MMEKRLKKNQRKEEKPGKQKGIQHMDKSLKSSLSPSAIELIQQWQKDGKRVDVDRPSWDQYFISQAHKISKRSMDSQTQCGCVITDQQHRPLGWGYNSFVAGIDDTILPNIRPDKHPFMIHSELNAIFNCTHPPRNGIAYATGIPCDHCLQCMWQAGIREIVFDKTHHANMCADSERVIITEILLALMQSKGLIFRGVDLNE
jgi:dCMP deaminase